MREQIEKLFAAGAAADKADARAAFPELQRALGAGEVRAAEPDQSSPTGWRVNVWVKQGILLGFRFGDIVDMGVAKGRWSFYDKDTLPMKRIDPSSGVRVVPGGSAIREGAYLGRGVICMPPMYVNIGAYVGEGTLVDSHALVGSCAQIGRSVHLSAAAQIGGVLEPVGAIPVIVEDDVLVGGNCGVYEGAIVRSDAPCLPPVPSSRARRPSTICRTAASSSRKPGQPLIVPEGAVVVPGARAVTVGAGTRMGLVARDAGHRQVP